MPTTTNYSLSLSLSLSNPNRLEEFKSPCWKGKSWMGLLEALYAFQPPSSLSFISSSSASRMDSEGSLEKVFLLLRRLINFLRKLYLTQSPLALFLIEWISWSHRLFCSFPPRSYNHHHFRKKNPPREIWISSEDIKFPRNWITNLHGKGERLVGFEFRKWDQRRIDDTIYKTTARMKN